MADSGTAQRSGVEPSPAGATADAGAEAHSGAPMPALVLGRHRGRLWRHRHEPALCAARIALACFQGGAAHGRGDHRRDVAAHLCADLHGHGQICAVPHARRQPRRRRHTVADGACAVGAGEARPHRLPARRRRRRAFFGRRDHHAGDLGALGRRGPRSRHGPFQGLCEFQRLCAGDHHRDPGPAVLGAKPRHGEGRGLFRADHGGVLPRDRRARRDAHSRRAADASRLQSADRPALPVSQWLAWLRGAGLRVSRRDGRGGALRRHGPFRTAADPGGLDLLRAAGAAAQLSGAGRADPRGSERDR